MLDTDDRRPALERARFDLTAMKGQLEGLLATHETEEPVTRWDGADDAIQSALEGIESALADVNDALAFDPTE